MEKNDKHITIVTDTGEEKDGEILRVVNIKDKGDYVIYMVDGECYGAKYKDNGTGTDLITDLTDEEKEALNKVFEMMGDGQC